MDFPIFFLAAKAIDRWLRCTLPRDSPLPLSFRVTACKEIPDEPFFFWICPLLWSVSRYARGLIRSHKAEFFGETPDSFYLCLIVGGWGEGRANRFTQF